MGVTKRQNSQVRPWTTRELTYMREHAGDGARAIAAALGRTEGAVRRAAHSARISLRRAGCRRGAVLGQPRGVSLRREMREGLLVYGDLIAERMRLDREAEDAQLCPACAVRRIRVSSSGLCRACHLRRLAELHREVLAEREAQRELWTQRQRLHRHREKASA